MARGTCLTHEAHVVTVEATYGTEDKSLMYCTFPATDRVCRCAVERRVFLVGAKPTQQFSFRLVATGAVHGGNDMY